MPRKGCCLVAEAGTKETAARPSAWERLVAGASPTGPRTDIKEAIENKKCRHDYIEIDEKKSMNMDMFPWITDFRVQCRLALACQNPSSLIKLIKLFNRNVSSNVNDCYKKSLRATKLKELIKEALLLFMYFNRFKQPQDQNRAVYLDLMSDLLAMYIDLELVASKRDAESQHGKISARLVSCLYVYLENSTEHLLNTLIKVQLVSETYCQILDAVFSKIFKTIPVHPETDVMYVRYLLVFRLWKKVHSNLAIKKQINASAISSLGSLPANLPTSLLEQVLPTRTATLTEAQSTKFYLCQHFDLRRACGLFLRYCRRSGGNEDGTNTISDITERSQRYPVEKQIAVVNCIIRVNFQTKSSSDESVVTVINKQQQHPDSSSFDLHLIFWTEELTTS